MKYKKGFEDPTTEMIELKGMEMSVTPVAELMLGLQQVMTQSSFLSGFDRDVILSTEANYMQWKSAVTLRLRMKGFGLADYFLKGTLPDVQMTPEEALRLLNLYNEAVTKLIYSTVRGNVLGTVSKSNAVGRDLFLALDQYFGRVTMKTVIDAASKWFTANSCTIQECTSAFSLLRNHLIPLLDEDSLTACWFILGLKMKGFPLTDIDTLLTRVQTEHGEDLKSFTPENVFPIAREIFGEKTSSVGAFCKSR